MTIEEMIEKTLHESFHMSYLLPAQRAVITRIMENSLRKEESDSITIMPTGMGKSLCFMLPALMLHPRYTILTYPLLSLMNDQAKRLAEAHIPYALIKGGMEDKERKREIERLRRHEASILITNAESLIILIKRSMLDFLVGNIELFVIDEAHTAVTWAESFRPALKEIRGISEYLRPHQRLCFSATCDSAILAGLKRDILANSDALVLRLSSDRPNIFYAALRSLSRKRDIGKILQSEERRPALVFCSYRSETEEYYQYFKDSFPSFYYHAGLERERKEEIEKLFHASDKAILFATNAYGMGVDKKDIRTVIHLHAPEDAASFLQESGRGGRDGGKMLSIVLYSSKDKGRLKDIFSGRGCIRHELLSLMGEKSDQRCSACSNCTSFNITPSGEKEILLLLSRLPFLLSRKSAAWVLSITMLKGWRQEEIAGALRALLEEKRIKSFFNRLYVPVRRK